jgi:hypothetical protein
MSRDLNPRAPRDDLAAFLAAALAKHGQPIELTNQELDTGFTISLKTSATGLRVHVTWGEEEDGG